MANSKVTQLTAATAITDDDLLYVVNDPLVTPASRKITVANMAASSTQRGLVELATTTEAAGGIDTARAVTPAGVAAYMAQPITIGVSGSIEGEVTLASLAAEDWHIVPTQATFFTHPDDILIISSNRSDVGTWDDAARPSIGMVMEADFYATAVIHYAEWYVEYRAGDGTVRRPFSTSVNIDTNAAINQIFGETSFLTDAGVQNAKFYNTGELYMTSATGTITQTTNNVPFIRQMNAAGGALIPLLSLDSLNWIEMGATLFVSGDVRHSTNAFGPILVDRATAANRRIVCTNGNLTTEAV